LTTRADREGAGENKETLTTSMSISDGEIPVLAKSLSSVSKMRSSNSVMKIESWNFF
jgi:hypothetical protein